MDNKEDTNISKIALELISLTFVLKACCENYEENISEFSKLVELSRILHAKAEEILDYV